MGSMSEADEWLVLGCVALLGAAILIVSRRLRTVEAEIGALLESQVRSRT
jgi:hypothetical protein